MKLLHTADWHLGQSFHDHDRTHEHEAFLEWLGRTCESEAVDALLVAGDVFDSSNPPAVAQRLLYRFLRDLRSRCPRLTVVIIAGNHDSPARLDAPAPILEDQRVIVRGLVHRTAEGSVDVERLVVPLTDASGATRCWCLAVPFLRPCDLPPGLAYEQGVASVYGAVVKHALTVRSPGQALVAMGHCHVQGGAVSEDSERRLVIGGQEALSGAVFDDSIAYVALGHLHRAQSLGVGSHRRYSGSPLPMSFSEVHYPHQVVLVELAGESVKEARVLRIPRTVDLIRVPPAPAPADVVIAALESLDVPDVPEDRRPFLQVRVLLETADPTLRSRVEAALGAKAVRLVSLHAESAARASGDADAPAISLEDLGRLDPLEVFARLHRDRYSKEAPDDLREAFARLVQAAQTADEVSP